MRGVFSFNYSWNERIRAQWTLERPLKATTFYEFASKMSLIALWSIQMALVLRGQYKTWQCVTTPTTLEIWLVRAKFEVLQILWFRTAHPHKETVLSPLLYKKINSPLDIFFGIPITIDHVRNFYGIFHTWYTLSAFTATCT